MKSPLWRKLAERLSRGKVFKRALIVQGGQRRLLYVTPEASLCYWLPRSLNRDTSLCDFAYKYLTPGAQVWDIGANVGAFTFLATSAVGQRGRVLSVEADPYISQLLIKSAQVQPAEDARPEIVTAAVSDAITLADFAVPNRSRASNHLLASPGCTQTGGIRFTFKVPCVTMDFLLEKSFAPSIVKMDIEGMESVALAAAPRLLSEVRPVFHLEVWSEISDSLAELLKRQRYVFFDGEKDLSLAFPVAAPVWCTIAVPEEKLTAVRRN